MKDAEQVQVESREAWRAWLEAHHTQPNGIWLVTFKKHQKDKYVSYEAIVEEALCFGWVDSTANRLDEDRSMLWLSPRKPGSGWSKPNKERIERMIAEGRMAPAGLEKIDAAKADGSWTRLDAVEALEIPPDLETALAAYPHARGHFDAFPRSVKRAILEWIVQAKRPETRAKRVEETARLAEENVRANQWRPGE